MASESAECYVIDRDGYTFGPYTSEREAHWEYEYEYEEEK